MKKNEAPKPPSAGVVYGEIAYWLAITGVIIALIGSVMYFIAEGYFEACMLDHLWQGDDAHIIWEECAGVAEVPHGYWYLDVLLHGDAVAMLGIAVACTAAAFGVWGATLAMLYKRERLYTIFALVVAAILTLSALGILSLH